MVGNCKASIFRALLKNFFFIFKLLYSHAAAIVTDTLQLQIMITKITALLYLILKIIFQWCNEEEKCFANAATHSRKIKSEYFCKSAMVRKQCGDGVNFKQVKMGDN
jgi:hypothetical protein